MNWTAAPSGAPAAAAALAAADASGWLQEVAAGGAAGCGGWHEATQVHIESGRKPCFKARVRPDVGVFLVWAPKSVRITDPEMWWITRG